MMISTVSKLVFLTTACSTLSSYAFVPSIPSWKSFTYLQQRSIIFVSTEQNAGAPEADVPSPSTPPPVLNGKMVLPMRVVMSGLAGHTLPAVYAVIRSGYTRGSDGWSQVEYISRTTNLYETLKNHIAEHGSDKVAHLRALSFSFPQEGAMQAVVEDWTESAKAAGAVTQDWGLAEVQLAMMGDEDDDDDDDEWETDDIPTLTPVDTGVVVSPFARSGEVGLTGQVMDFTQTNVDKVLEEVRPYLISDGGNVSVQKVDPATYQVFLKLEGACGSCPSSTVTMKMGIERVLKENFPNVEVFQVEEETDNATELTYEAIEEEIKRIRPAITAMGGMIEIILVDPIGEVTLSFRGANKVRQGLEMALLDVPFCKHIKFVST